jgi:hypothetical protein
MIIHSINFGGVMGAQKQQALKRMCAIYKPDVLLLQEIVCVGYKVVEFLSSFLKE